MRIKTTGNQAAGKNLAVVVAKEGAEAEAKEEVEVEIEVEIINNKVKKIKNSNVVPNMMKSTYGESVQRIGRVTPISKSMAIIDMVKEEDAAEAVVINHIIRNSISIYLHLLRQD